MGEEKRTAPIPLDYNGLLLKQMDRITIDMRDSPDNLGADAKGLEMLNKAILRQNTEYEESKIQLKKWYESEKSDCFDGRLGKKNEEAEDGVTIQFYIKWIDLIMEHIERAGKMPR